MQFTSFFCVNNLHRVREHTL